jgi:hypothetical protein
MKMCDHNDTVETVFLVPARLSHNGRRRLKWGQVDRCIAPLIRELNEAGLFTSQSCCGHGKMPGQIDFHGGLSLTPEEARCMLDMLLKHDRENHGARHVDVSDEDIQGFSESARRLALELIEAAIDGRMQEDRRG